jgi:hypothetical protein
MSSVATGRRAVDINSSRSIVSAILLGVVGPEVFIVQPGFVQGMVQYLGFADKAAGYVASAEMWGIAATTVALTFVEQRLNWRKTVLWSLAVMVLANIASTVFDQVTTFAVLRFVAGIGAGGLISLSFGAIGLTSHPDRNFGYLIMWVLTYGALALWAIRRSEWRGSTASCGSSRRSRSSRCRGCAIFQTPARTLRRSRRTPWTCLARPRPSRWPRCSRTSSRRVSSGPTCS